MIVFLLPIDSIASARRPPALAGGKINHIILLALAKRIVYPDGICMMHKHSLKYNQKPTTLTHLR